MNSLRRRPTDLAVRVRKNTISPACSVSPLEDVTNSAETKATRSKTKTAWRITSRRATRISGILLCILVVMSVWSVSFLVRHVFLTQQQQHWMAHVRSTLQLLVSTRNNREQTIRRPTTIVFSYSDKTKESFGSLSSMVRVPLDELVYDDAYPPSADYGNLAVSSSSLSSSLSSQHSPRYISSRDYSDYERFRNQSLEEMDAAKRHLPRKLWHADELLWTNNDGHERQQHQHQRQCYPNNWGRSDSKPVCNSLHEIRMMDRPYSPAEVDQELDIRYKASGYFRDVWLLERAPMQQYSSLSTTTVVLKKFQLQDYFPLAEHELYQVQKEAIILAHLSASDRIIDIYGYCGISLLAEAAIGDVVAEMVPTSGYIQQRDLDRMQINDVHPMNNMTLTAKIDMAIIMAESLADIHGYKGGVIAHGDVHPEQWLRTLDGRFKLNDFNLGEILDWDPWNKTYCNVDRCYSGWYHAPEELKCVKGNEAFDVFSIGNNLYALLTGLWPYYGETEYNERALVTHVKFGGRPFVDDRYRHRSMVEGRLVEIMEACWEFDFAKRISIFDVVRQLRDLKAHHDEDGLHVS
jgi:hypothetical protein